MEHSSFTEREADAFTQLCRVVILDFLPFVRKCFDSLFSVSSVEQLALSTPYALRHRKTRCQDGSTIAPSLRPSVQLDMELDVKVIGEVLRGIAPGIFEEQEAQAVDGGGGEGGSVGVASLSVDIEGLLSKASLDQPLLASPASQPDDLAPNDSISTSSSPIDDTGPRKTDVDTMSSGSPEGLVNSTHSLSPEVPNGSESVARPMSPDPIFSSSLSPVPNKIPSGLVPAPLQMGSGTLPTVALGTWSNQLPTS